MNTNTAQAKTEQTVAPQLLPPTQSVVETLEHKQERLRASTDGLAKAAPDLSAKWVLSPGQRVLGIGVLALLAMSFVLAPALTGQVIVGLITFAYLVSLAYRLVLFGKGVQGEHLQQVSDEEALAVPDAELPAYTVLLPAFREPLIGELLEHLERIDYPRDRLEILVLLEQDDDETVSAARAAKCGDHVRVVLVPPAQPRTKPKACNYGLMESRGEIVTIYDAEDVPDPLQLRRAVVALRRLGPDYACIQAQLGYFNSKQNLLTRWFTVEYGTWFAFLLPGLVSLGAPVPLGGTSNHFRADVLRRVGAWDPHNVTEDADLGIRLARLGYRVGVLESVTLEEANSDAINWVKQRSRWYKGYIQTFLVHTRQLRSVGREIGWRGLLGLFLFVAGTPLLAAVNGCFWALTGMWFLRRSDWISALFPPVVYYAGLICFAFGNAAVLYMNFFTTRRMGRPDLMWSALVMPLYWILMWLAAVKAVVQLVVNPSYWEKTAHGLHLAEATA